MSCSDQKPNCIVNPCIVMYRELLFHSIKKPVLDQIMYPKSLDETINYDADLFLGMLDNFVASPKPYNGVRVYFASYVPVAGSPIAIPAGKEQQLTLIFVPTYQTSKCAAMDDLDQCFWLSENTLQHLPNPSSVNADLDVASAWINNFQLNRLPALEANGRKFTHNPAFQEAKTLWYTIETFAGSSTDRGLIDYIYCLRETPDDPSDPLDKIVVHFGAFTPTDCDTTNSYYFRLTLIFDLHQKNDDDVSKGMRASAPEASRPAFGSSTPWVSKGGKWTKNTLLLTDGGGGDTGVPCPPDTGCTDGGSLLPAS